MFSKALPLLLTIGAVVGLGSVGCSTLTAQHGSQESPTTAMGGSPMAMGDSMDHAMNMDLGPADDQVDLRFIDAMMLHHQGAVVMAQDALAKSTRPEIRDLATAIIAAQEEEISQMQQWRQAWYADAPAEPMMFHAEMNHMMPMSEEMRSSMMMSMDLGPADDQYDLRFLDAMIPHHEGALTMAQEILDKSQRPEVRQMAEAILSSQQGEITQMQEWRRTWYNK